MNEQITEEQLKTMTPHQIVQAQEEGRLDAVLGRPMYDIPAEGQLSEEHLTHMTPHQIVEARDAGRLDELLRGDQGLGTLT
ncbi:hypothetical protein OH738_29410 [Streptomyces hirsutus]|uniref:hypothetical protein n=1 Tax=Streptomyces hirsutus TaxID=35620 RepID=UPI0038675FB4|nr:hypothetical protein OH738_29410 [Streptomyces hirsutus]